MERIRRAQGTRSPRPPGSLTAEALSGFDGEVQALDNLKLAQCAKLAGAPMDAGAGLDLLKKVGDPVRAGEPLFRIHAEEQADMGYAWDYWQRHPEMVQVG
jgi:thymidine phosphorylase